MKEFGKTKVCSLCHIEKDISEFTWIKATNKPHSWCKKCRSMKQVEKNRAEARPRNIEKAKELLRSEGFTIKQIKETKKSNLC